MNPNGLHWVCFACSSNWWVISLSVLTISFLTLVLFFLPCPMGSEPANGWGLFASHGNPWPPNIVNGTKHNCNPNQNGCWLVLYPWLFFFELFRCSGDNSVFIWPLKDKTILSSPSLKEGAVQVWWLSVPGLFVIANGLLRSRNIKPALLHLGPKSETHLCFNFV